MLELNAYINTVNGSKDTSFANVFQKEIRGVTAVYMDGVSRYNIDGENGACIEINADNIKNWMANYKYGEFWLKPSFGESVCDIPDETQGFIFEKYDGTFGVILPVVSEKYKCVLTGGEDKIIAKLYSWYDKMFDVKALAFIYAEGVNPFELLKKCAKEASRILNNGLKLREERNYPKTFEYLGWCSWDAFAINVTEDNLIDKCKEFKEKNIPVCWMVLDDMWADVKDFKGKKYSTFEQMVSLMYSSKLYSCEADKERFPDGLKGCIEKIKEYGIKVGIWYPTTGYWRGIDTDGELYKDVKDYLIIAPNGMYVPDYKQQNAYMYYDKFNSFLRKCGAEFVKIDNQSMTGRFYKGKAPVGVIAREFHNAMEASVCQNFGNNMINCMGMSSEDMWNRSSSPVIRCSDDFKPENKEWFTKSILQCSFNSLIHGQFYYCDWDMWWTDDAQGIKNSILRAISGGPIYVSDKLNRSRLDVLKPLIFNDGKILRCDRPAMPTADCLTVDPTRSGSVFKIQNVCGSGGVIAAFNLKFNNGKAKGTVSPSDIDGISGDEFVIYEYFSKKAVAVKKNGIVSVELENNDDFRLFTIVPIINGFAPIGRIDKFISLKSVKAVNNKEIELYESGPYALWKNGNLIIREQ